MYFKVVLKNSVSLPYILPEFRTKPKCDGIPYTVADPGFPRRGAQPNIRPIFPEECMKLKKITRVLKLSM